MRNTIQDLPIHAKVNIIVWGISLGIVVIMCTFFCLEFFLSFKTSMLYTTQILGEVVSQNTAASLVFNDRETASELLSGLTSNKQIAYACIRDAQDTIFASYQKNTKNTYSNIEKDITYLQNNGVQKEDITYLFTSAYLTMLQKITLGGKTIGQIYIVVELDNLVADFNKFILLTVILSGVLFFLAMLLNAKMLRVILRPINHLVSAMDEVTRTKNYGLRVHKTSNDELGKLMDGFNTMLQTIEQWEAQLKQAVTAGLTAKNEAQSASRAKSQFLANMSHEIRTPMNGVLGMVQILQKTPLNARQARCAELIRTSGQNLLALINDLLDFSKIEAGKLYLETETFNPYTLINDTRDMFAIQAQAKRLTLISFICTDISSAMQGDPNRIRQILINLVGNAIKFTQTGHIVIRVRVDQADGNDVTLHVEVQDTGIGIARHHQTKIFESFVQGDSSTTRNFGGTGLGLAVTKELVHMMKGRIGITSRPNHGSTFWFTIRLQKSSSREKPPKSCLQAATTLTLPARHPETTRPSAKKKILVVEDNEANQEVLVDVLEFMNCSVTLACDGKKAVYLASQSSFDLILMDCQMPVMDGFEATRHIRNLKDPKHANVPIVAMTALAQENDKKACLDAGMNDYQSKPFSMDKLEHCIKKWTTNMGRDESPNPR
jgi:signal transduction histidine kinase/ActR/RegA family two-component response regulator